MDLVVVSPHHEHRGEGRMSLIAPRERRIVAVKKSTSRSLTLPSASLGEQHCCEWLEASLLHMLRTVR